jgi:hypothetical protein
VRSQEEDDGIILSAILYGGELVGGPNSLSLVILGAKKLELLAKVDFETNAVIPKCLHGWFFPQKKGTVVGIDRPRTKTAEKAGSSN